MSGMKSGNYSIANAERYTRADPNAASPLKIEIGPGRAIMIAISTH